MKEDFRIALTTVSSLEEAQSLSNLLLAKQLAGCVNTIKIENSSYFWDGKLNNSPEFLLSIKTTGSLISEITKLFDQVHPYQTYFFTVIEPESVNKSYYDWILANTKK